MNFEARLQEVINEGQAVRATYRPNAPAVIGATTLGQGRYNAWVVQAQSVLNAIGLGAETQASGFKRVTNGGARAPNADAGIGVLQSVLNDLKAGHLQQPPASPAALDLLINLFERFHDVARQLRKRHADRVTLDVNDEYDVQDLLHALLLLHFQDVRAEDPSPTYAGGASRTDFVLKNEKTVVEVKKTRKGLDARTLGEELIIDSRRYQAHLDCETLVCFVYDPEGRIANPRGVENDLNQDTPLKVRVLIRPH